ncbi:zinc finger protein 443-like [Drosophila montana]|uniref:zinc finger protein 443-like n=1 Tax=Drosophila montana TaxID=40370 RepID=UPI00313AD09D
MDSAICRICLNSSVTLVHIFAKREQIYKGQPEPCLADMLNECADCHIKSNDTLPQHICLSCILSAQNAFRFKRTCEQSYRQLVANAKSNLRQTNKINGSNGTPTEIGIKQEQEVTADEVPSEVGPNPILCPSQSHKCAPTPPKASPPRHEQLKRPRSSTTISAENKSQKYESKETQKKAGNQQEQEATAEEAPSEISSNLLYKCQVCSKQFAHMSILSLHKKWHLEIKSSAKIIAKPKVNKVGKGKKKQQQCSICEKKYATVHLLKRHISTHSTERPYACTLCPTTFRLATNLKRHMRNHTGERPYKCPWCTESFARSDYCRSHMERDHNGLTFNGRLFRKS